MLRLRKDFVLFIITTLHFWESSRTVVAEPGILRFLARIKSKLVKGERMGQAVRMIKYDRAANERNAVSALKVGFYGCVYVPFLTITSFCSSKIPKFRNLSISC